MEFCPRCGKILLPNCENEKKTLRCGKCGYEKILNDKSVYKHQKLKRKESKREVIIIEPEKEFIPLPKTDETCPRCGNKEAYWKLLQTRSADEPSTRFYRCTKCSKNWREY